MARFEDGVCQMIAHFSQEDAPVSVGVMAVLVGQALSPAR